MHLKTRKCVRLLAKCVDLQRKLDLFRRHDTGIYADQLGSWPSHRIVERRNWMAYNWYDTPRFIQSVANFHASWSQLRRRNRRHQ